MKLIKIFLFILLLGLVLSLFVGQKYREYEYYNSLEMRDTKLVLYEYLKGYKRQNCKYPPNGQVLLNFLEEDSEFVKSAGYEINHIIKEKGMGFFEDSTNGKVFLFTPSETITDSKSLRYISDISFMEYLMGTYKIALVEDKWRNICDEIGIGFSHIGERLFVNDTLIHNEALERKIRRIVNPFRYRIRQRCHHDPSALPLWLLKPLYLRAVVKNDSFTIDVVCDPFDGRKDTESIIDSLHYLLNDVILNSGVDEIYFPVTLYDVE